MPATDGLLRLQIKSKSSMPCTALGCIPLGQSVQFAAYQAHSLDKTSCLFAKQSMLIWGAHGTTWRRKAGDVVVDGEGCTRSSPVGPIGSGSGRRHVAEVGIDESGLQSVNLKFSFSQNLQWWSIGRISAAVVMPTYLDYGRGKAGTDKEQQTSKTELSTQERIDSAGNRGTRAIDEESDEERMEAKRRRSKLWKLALAWPG
jgi:hypothetical protein